LKRREAIRVHRFNVAAERDDQRRLGLVVAGHAAVVQRHRASRADVVYQIRVALEPGFETGRVVEEARCRRVPAARVDRPWPGVVVLVLSADHDAPVCVALHDSAVDARPDGVGVGVESLAVGAAGEAVFLCHSSGEGIVRNPHTVFTV